MEKMDVYEKLKILADSAKFDVSCTSSGVSRANNRSVGNAYSTGICHTWTADGRCVSLLKILFTNDCCYDCKYCVNRRTAGCERATFEPDELAKLTIEFYRRNYIEGLFLSSAVYRSPDYTAERILECLRLLRKKYGFAGYIHAKVIPKISPELLYAIGLEADRLSINAEFPTMKEFRLLTPQKRPEDVIEPMRRITNRLIDHKALKGPGLMFKGKDLNRDENYLSAGSGEIRNIRMNMSREIGEDAEDPKASKSGKPAKKTLKSSRDVIKTDDPNETVRAAEETLGPAMHPDGREAKKFAMTDPRRRGESFAPAGQSTQMMIGAAGETDRQVLDATERLYRTFKMKRVYYSAYVPVVSSPLLPDIFTAPPLGREHRLYQADWLLRYYGFDADEIVGADHPFLDPELDPKISWALRNMQIFPIEVNRARMEELLRIPGIGNLSALRIVRQRKYRAVTYEDLKKMGVVLKRAKHFMTCGGKFYGDKRMTPEAIRSDVLQINDGTQISMFDNGAKSVGLENPSASINRIGHSGAKALRAADSDLPDGGAALLRDGGAR